MISRQGRSTEVALARQQVIDSLFWQLIAAKQRIEELECALEEAKADGDYWFNRYRNSEKGGTCV
jgi:hypothetical protein